MPDWFLLNCESFYHVHIIHIHPSEVYYLSSYCNTTLHNVTRNSCALKCGMSSFYVAINIFTYKSLVEIRCFRKPFKARVTKTLIFHADIKIYSNSEFPSDLKLGDVWLAFKAIQEDISRGSKCCVATFSVQSLLNINYMKTIWYLF